MVTAYFHGFNVKNNRKEVAGLPFCVYHEEFDWTFHE